MKSLLRVAFVVAAVLTMAGAAAAQPWKYDFGMGTASLVSGIDSTNSVMPPPETNGGKARARVGSGSGSINIENQLISFGSGSYLRGVAPTATSVTKVSLYNYTQGQAFTIRFRLRLGSQAGTGTAASGTWSMFVGDSSAFSDNSTFTGRHLFMGIRWVFGSSGSIVTTYRSGSTWAATGLTATPFTQGVTYIVELYGNNSPSEIPYTHNGAQSVSPYTFDLWIDGVLSGDNLPKAQLSDNANIDSWMFYGESSTSNAANIFLDDVVYTNTIADNPLPIQLAFFSARSIDANSIAVTWRTLSELNNYGFEVERSPDGAHFVAAPNGFVAGHGTSSVPNDYSFTDNPEPPGPWYYRLRQIDLDGTTHFSDPVKADLLSGVADMTPTNVLLGQNYPNPFNPSTKIGYRVSGPGASNNGTDDVALGTEALGAGSGGSGLGARVVRLSVYDILGREVAVLVNEAKAPGEYSVAWDASEFSAGVYICRMTAGDYVESRKMLFIR
jgi:hypothetical protein